MFVRGPFQFPLHFFPVLVIRERRSVVDRQKSIYLLTIMKRGRALLFVFLVAFSSSFSRVEFLFFASAEGELRTTEEGHLVARKHFPVRGVVPIEALSSPSSSSSRTDVSVSLTVSGFGSPSVGQKMRATLSKRDGRFTIHDVPPGEHRLEVFCVGFSFPPIIVTVDGENDGNVEARYAEDRETVLEKTGVVRDEETGKILDFERVIVAPVSRVDYFEPSNRMTLSGMLKNPMVLMFVATLVMSIIVPSMIRNMDAETLEELQKEMGKGNIIDQLSAVNRVVDESVDRTINQRGGEKDESKRAKKKANAHR